MSQILLIWWHLTLSIAMSILVQTQGNINSCHYFFTLPNSLNDNSFVHMVQQDTTMFDLQELTHEELVNHRQAKENVVKARELEREATRKGKLVWLKRELIRKAELGELGLIWRNQERRAPGVKRIKKEEPWSPIIKVETPPSPELKWPPTPLSRYQSIDPNDFIWLPRYAPSPI